jgi:hypothetical protein
VINRSGTKPYLFNSLRMSFSAACWSRPRHREAPRAWSVEEQSSGELASADPATRAQDAGLQEPRISPTISLHSCSRLQHLQRPTPFDISVDAPEFPRRGDGHLACGGRLRTYDTQPRQHAAFSRSSFSNVTRPSRTLAPSAAARGRSLPASFDHLVGACDCPGDISFEVDGEAVGGSHADSPTANRRPDRYNSRCSALRQCEASGTRTGVMSRSR